MRATPFGPLALLAAVFMLVACGETIEIEPPDPPDDHLSPQEARQLPCDSRRAAFAIQAVGQATNSISSNEVHDCQEFVIAASGGGLEYGPLVAIYPDSAAADIDDPAGFSGWVLVARIHNFGVRSPVGPPAADPPRQPQRYGPLGIEPGENCLLLRHQTGQWQAVVLQDQGTGSDTTCVNVDPPADAGPYDVHIWGDGTIKGHHAYPSTTARWGWDGAPATRPSWFTGSAQPTRTQYIGVKCAAEWCVLGRRGFTPRTDPQAQSASGYPRIPGLYDEQLLAIPEGSGGALVPGPWGVISPLPDTTLTGATVRISGNGAGHYRSKGSTGGSSSGSGEIRLTRNSVNDPWTARIQRPGLPEHASNRVTYVPHARHGPGLGVRWRWQDQDESGWIPCQGGCCDYSGRNLI